MKNKYPPRNTFLSSMGLAIDLGATRTASQLSSIVDDFESVKISSEHEAMEKDWSVIGEDILSAMIVFTKENDQAKK